MSLSVEKFNSALFLYFDVETTGRSPKFNRICQISAVFRHRGLAVGALTTLVNPRCKIPESTSKIHGITNERVKDSPAWFDVGRRLRSKAHSLGKKFETEVLVAVAYNGKFDVAFVKTANKRMKILPLNMQTWFVIP